MWFISSHLISSKSIQKIPILCAKFSKFTLLIVLIMSNNLKIISDPVHGFIKIPYRIILDVIEHLHFQRFKENLLNWVIEFDFPRGYAYKISSRNRSNAFDV